MQLILIICFEEVTADDIGETNETSNTSHAKEKELLLSRIHHLDKLNSQLKENIENFCELKTIGGHIDSLENIGENTKDFCKMLLTPKNVYTQKQKELACNLNFRSNSCYKFMREQLHFHMPSVRSIQNFFPIKQLQPGFSFKLNANLRTLARKMSKKERLAVLIFDEISIRKDLTYNDQLDQIDGFQHLSNEERTKLIGKHICVFMLRGLFSNWKYVLNYFVTENAISAEKIKAIIGKNIKISKSCNISVRALCGDQGKNNVKSYRLIGVSPEKPYVIIEGVKIYFLFDAPHLIKNVRNNLLNNSSLKTPDGEAKWSLIYSLFLEDQKSLIRRCPRLT